MNTSSMSQSTTRSLTWFGLGLIALTLLGASCTTSQPTATPITTNSTNTTTVRQPESNTLTVYAYDSLTADYGLLPQIVDDFESTEGVTVNIVSFSDTGTMLNQLLLEQDNPYADVVMGLDNVNFAQIQSLDQDSAEDQTLLQSYQPLRATDIAPDLWFDDNYTMTPFDFGYVGFVYDSAVIDFPEPISLTDLASAEYQDKIIIEQAGVSSPGTQFMLWVQAALGNGEDTTAVTDYWTQLADTVLTVAPDWGTAYYSQFLEGEAPIVLSYLTSPAYHIDQEDTDQYKAIPMTDGYIRQVEGVAVVNGTTNPTAAEDFIDYILTDDVQNAIPTTQWVFPVLGDSSQWPEAYSQIITPTEDNTLAIDSTDLKSNYDNWLQQWNQAFSVQ